MSVADYKTALLALDPPGLYEGDDLHEDLVEACARALSGLDAGVAQLELELLPHSAEQTLAEWAETFRLRRRAGATVADEQLALASRWRGGLGSSLRDLRKQLGDLLRPEYAMRDTFDDAKVHHRWSELPGAGSIAETTALELRVAAAVDGDWTSEAAPRLLEQLHDITDGVVVEAKITSVGANGAAGVVLHEDWSNALQLGVWPNEPELALGVVQDGVATRYGAMAIPATPFWVRLTIDRHEGIILAQVGADLDGHLVTVAQLQLEDVVVTPQQVGLWCQNFADTKLLAVHEFGEARWRHATQYNNVVIEEYAHALAPETNTELVFQLFVHRDPRDAGSYDLQEAQQQADRAKQGHTLIMVGESDQFRAGDPHSLTGRDVLGR